MFLPIVILLALALVIFLPGVTGLPIGGLLRVNPKTSGVKSAVKIWANTRSGLYYCPDSKMYGKLTPGVYMSQGEALQGGYQPAGKQTCR